MNHFAWFAILIILPALLKIAEKQVDAKHFFRNKRESLNDFFFTALFFVFSGILSAAAKQKGGIYAEAALSGLFLILWAIGKFLKREQGWFLGPWVYAVFVFTLFPEQFSYIQIAAAALFLLLAREAAGQFTEAMRIRLFFSKLPSALAGLPLFWLAFSFLLLAVSALLSAG